MILADTHAWIWWICESRRLSKRALAAFDRADSVGLSAISAWEIAMLVARGRLQFDRDVLLWLRQSLATPRTRLVPITPEVAVVAANLEWSHQDPADRIITATARVHSCAVVTKDERLRSFEHLQTIW